MVIVWVIFTLIILYLLLWKFPDPRITYKEWKIVSGFVLCWSVFTIILLIMGVFLK